MELRRLMNKLRMVLPSGGKNLEEEEVLEQTVALIEDLERRLLAKLKSGAVPEKLQQSLTPRNGIQGVLDLRNAMARLMKSN